LFDRYVYVFVAAADVPYDERIAGPVCDTREVSWAWVVRATTLRATVPRWATPRDTTPRDAVEFERDAVFARDTTLRETVAELLARDADAVVPRTRNEPLLRAAARDVAFARGDAVLAATVGVTTGAIGSANTARIDKNVEQTKNAPASKNTVLTAFLTKSAISRLFINYSPADKKPTNPPLSVPSVVLHHYI
jgi:hypothetical protein